MLFDSKKLLCLTFPADFYIIWVFFFNLNYNFSNVLNLGNLQEQVKKVYCFKNCTSLHFHCSNKLIQGSQNFENSRPSALNFKSFSWSLEQFFSLSIGQNNFRNKIPLHDLKILNSVPDFIKLFKIISCFKVKPLKIIFIALRGSNVFEACFFSVY